MNAGKSTALLQSSYNYQERGMRAVVYTAEIDDRFGAGKVSSRIGLSSPAKLFNQNSSLYEEIRAENEQQRIHCVLVDESQFLTRQQVYELSEVVDQLDIPVSALTRMERKLDYKSIIGRKEGVVVPLNIYHIDDSTEQIIQTIKKEAGNRNLNTTIDGQYFSGQETLWEMVVVVIVAILMLYFILAAQFESLTLPIILLVEIPLDVAFTLLILWLSGISLNLMSMIGIVVMSGIVINDSILKIDTIIRLQRSGLALEEAIHEGGVRRLKPILMTSLTTIFALVPMLWGNDIGTQLQRPMSITLIAGMTVGTFVSLFIIPLFYYYLERIFISRKK